MKSILQTIRSPPCAPKNQIHETNQTVQSTNWLRNFDRKKKLHLLLREITKKRKVTRVTSIELKNTFLY